MCWLPTIMHSADKQKTEDSSVELMFNVEI